MLKERFDRLREGGALVHNITNYVTVNDVANILLAAGASPIMSDDIEDAPEITAICGGLNINIGTLNQRTVPAMFASGKKARELGHPVLLDPVGSQRHQLLICTDFLRMSALVISICQRNDHAKM